MSTKQKLELGRTDVMIGELIVAWIECFAGEGCVVHYDVADGHHNEGGYVTADQCLKVIRGRIGKKPPKLTLVHRPGTERTWREAHPK